MELVIKKKQNQEFYEFKRNEVHFFKRQGKINRRRNICEKNKAHNEILFTNEKNTI